MFVFFFFFLISSRRIQESKRKQEERAAKIAEETRISNMRKEREKQRVAAQSELAQSVQVIKENGKSHLRINF